jgi:Holliday junction resolvasome RuvABC endonuclease subunit
MKRGLALDIATFTGAAFDKKPGRPAFATYRVPSVDDPDDFGTRYVAFSDWLAEMISVIKPDWGAFEAPLPQRGSNLVTNFRTARLLGGLVAHAEAEFVRAGIPCGEENVSTIKKHLTGNGRAEKADIMARCRQLGWEIKNDHEADAAALWAYCHCKVNPSFSYSTTPLGAGV